MADALPGSQFLVDARCNDGRNILRDACRHDAAPGFQETPARVGECRDDVFFKRIVAERFRDDHIDGEFVAKLRRVARNEMASLRLVCLQHLGSDARDFRGFKQKNFFRAKFCRHQAEQSGTSSDIGHNRFAGLYDGLQRTKKRFVPNFVGNQRPMIFDAHVQSFR